MGHDQILCHQKLKWVDKTFDFLCKLFLNLLIFSLKERKKYLSNIWITKSKRLQKTNI